MDSVSKMDTPVQSSQHTMPKGYKLKPLSNWTTDDVLFWLSKRNKTHLPSLPDFVSEFRKHSVCGKSLRGTTALTIAAFKVGSESEQRELLRCILRLRLKHDLLEMKAMRSQLKSSEA